MSDLLDAKREKQKPTVIDMQIYYLIVDHRMVDAPHNACCQTHGGWMRLTTPAVSGKVGIHRIPKVLADCVGKLLQVGRKAL